MNKLASRRNWHKCASFTLLLLVMACASKKQTIVNNISEINAVVQQLAENKIKFDWFKARVKCNYQLKDEDGSFEIHIKTRADSVIYMTIRKFDVTAAKVLLETDSVTFLNTGKQGTDKYYTIRSYDYLNTIIGAELVFKMAQDMIFANANGLDTTLSYVTQYTETGYYISLLEPKEVERAISEFDTQNGTIIRQYWVNEESGRLSTQKLHSIVDTTSLVMQYNEYELFDNIAFPLEQTMTVITPRDTIIVEMSFGKVEFNEPQNITLTIPDSYEKR